MAKPTLRLSMTTVADAGQSSLTEQFGLTRSARPGQPILGAIKLNAVGGSNLIFRKALSFALIIGGHSMTANPALNLAPFGRWTLRDKAAQSRLALR
jgi:hypothetical protein